MFDYPKWKSWLEEKAAQPSREGFKFKFRASPDDIPKASMEFGVIGQKAMANFENWITGETDFTVMSPVSPNAKIVSHKWMLVLTDETFETAFAEFMEAFLKYEIPH